MAGAPGVLTLLVSVAGTGRAYRSTQTAIQRSRWASRLASPRILQIFTRTFLLMRPIPLHAPRPRA